MSKSIILKFDEQFLEAGKTYDFKDGRGPQLINIFHRMIGKIWVTTENEIIDGMFLKAENGDFENQTFLLQKPLFKSIEKLADIETLLNFTSYILIKSQKRFVSNPDKYAERILADLKYSASMVESSKEKTIEIREFFKQLEVQ